MKRKYVLIALVGVTAMLVWTSGAFASTSLTLCVSKDGTVKVRETCKAMETQYVAASDSDVAALRTRVTALENKVTVLENLLSGVTRQTVNAHETLLFNGLNLQVVNGAGNTSDTNGVGNVIIGYDISDEDTKTGSHNLVIGDLHTYTGSSGIVSGINNTLSGDYSFVGGFGNTASGNRSFVGGGGANTASGNNSFVGGGIFSTASGNNSFVGGGTANVSSGSTSFVGGGDGNTASGTQSFVAGGNEVLAGPGTCAYIVNLLTGTC